MKNNNGKLISSSEIVRKYSISYQTLNYYTNLGFFQFVDKIGNKRFYDEENFRKNFEKIRSLKAEGYTLGLIRKVLDGSL